MTTYSRKETLAKQMIVAEAMAQGTPIRAVAQAAGISRQALNKWLKTPEMVAAIAHEKDLLLDRALLCLLKDRSTELEFYVSKLQDANTPVAERVRIANLILTKWGGSDPDVLS